MFNTDTDLVDQLKQKNESAFRYVVKKYQDQVVNTCYGLVQNKDDAEDLAQEVFLEVYRSIYSFNNQSKLSTWIYRISINKSLEWVRKDNRKKRWGQFKNWLGLTTEPDELENKSTLKPDEQLEDEERKKILQHHLQLLNERQRTALVMLYFEELTYQEITEIMNISVSSVESLLFRARQNLKNKLTTYYEHI